MILNYINVFFRVITFIGAYIKFTLETLVCKFFKIPPSVSEDNHSMVNFGHAVHYNIDHLPTQFLICFLPSLAMTVVGLITYLSGLVPLAFLRVRPTDDFTGTVSYGSYVIYIIFIVIGVMLLSNVFPSIVDARILYEQIYVTDESSPFVKVIAFLPCMYTFLGTFLERSGIITAVLSALPIILIQIQK